MCVAILKPAGVRFPTQARLKKCWAANPHGAGFMARAGNDDVRIQKGFMSFSSFWKAFRAAKFRVADEVVIHFRRMTRGEVSPGHCHPFPLLNTRTALMATEIVAEAGMAHNGTIRDLAEVPLSDTQVFVRDVLSDPAIWRHIETLSVQKLINMAAAPSRLVVMPGKGNTVLFGNWENVGGVFYSNLRWQGGPSLRRGTSCEKKSSTRRPLRPIHEVDQLVLSGAGFDDGSVRCPYCREEAMTTPLRGGRFEYFCPGCGETFSH